MARFGWGHAPSLYAPIVTRALLNQPGLPVDIAAQMRGGRDDSEEHLPTIVQEDLAEDEFEEMLVRLAWSSQAQGAALTVERLVVPPEVKEQAPEDPEGVLKFISDHPSGTSVCLAVGALCSGESRCVLRMKAFDSDDKVRQGSNLLPNLVKASLLSLDTEGAVEAEGTPSEPRSE